MQFILNFYQKEYIIWCSRDFMLFFKLGPQENYLSDFHPTGSDNSLCAYSVPLCQNDSHQTMLSRTLIRKLPQEFKISGKGNPKVFVLRNYLPEFVWLMSHNFFIFVFSFTICQHSFTFRKIMFSCSFSRPCNILHTKRAPSISCMFSF